MLLGWMLAHLWVPCTNISCLLHMFLGKLKLPEVSGGRADIPAAAAAAAATT